MFFNVFGRKKEKNGHNGSSSTATNVTTQLEEEFVCVQENGTVRGENGHSSSATQSVYPALQLTNNMFQQATTVSNSTQNQSGHKSDTLSSINSYSPIDNLPFNVATNCHLQMTNVTENLHYSYTAIERVGMFLNSVHQSEYNFDIERSIIRD